MKNAHTEVTDARTKQLHLINLDIEGSGKIQTSIGAKLIELYLQKKSDANSRRRLLCIGPRLPNRHHINLSFR
jgi:hypothetical protein